MKKTFDEQVQDILVEYKDVFQALMDGHCPLCKKRIRGDRYNLGEKYCSFEGCKECYDLTQRKES